MYSLLSIPSSFHHLVFDLSLNPIPKINIHRSNKSFNKGILLSLNAKVTDLRAKCRNSISSEQLTAEVFEGKKERIKKMFEKVELSMSSYDTAWVAMIPSPTSPEAPLFPQCLNWLLENQLNDGSWGLSHSVHDELFTKDYLLSTLACVLALKRWGVGEQQYHRGLQYIESNIASVNDEKQHSPIGFDIIFLHLIEHARKWDLNLPAWGMRLEAVFQNREFQLKRGCNGSNSEGWEAYLAYISEGLGESQNWEMAMKYQRKNGSLFNSPAATAVAFTHLNDTNCVDYLFSLVKKFGNAVPTVHPFDVYSRIYMVDNLEKLGIGRHFKEEIQSVLDETYRLWQHEEEDIFLEPTICAMAFRLLRLHRYEVSSDALCQFSKDKFSSSLQGYLKDIESVLELHKASQIVLHSDDSVLGEINSWTKHFLKEYFSSSSKNIHKPLDHIDHEIHFVVGNPHHTYLDRILNRKIMENCKVDQKRILKTSHSFSGLSNKEFLELAVEDFNSCQLVIREEFEQYYRWIKESGLDKFQWPRPKLDYNFFTAAGTLVSPELGEARLSWAKNGLLASVIDDMFDVWGSEQDQIMLVQLMEKWEVDIDKENCSETVKTLFLALKGTICDIADQAFKVQGRSVLSHLIQLWVDALRSHLKEAQWQRSKHVPSCEEYFSNSLISFSLGPVVLLGLYLVGPKLSQEIIESDEYNQLWEVVSICGRLLNDINGYKREKEQGKLNTIGLRVIHGSGSVTEEDIVKKMKREIDDNRKELLRLVLLKKGSKVPADVKDVIWKIAKSLHVVYKKDDHDVFHAQELSDEGVNIMNQVLHNPIILK